MLSSSVIMCWINDERIGRYFREDAPEAASSVHRNRSMSGTRMDGVCETPGISSITGVGAGNSAKNLTSYRYRSPGAPIDGKIATSKCNAVVGGIIEPRLAIIDFNQLTRGGLDLATGKNRAKVERHSPQRHSYNPPRR